MERKRNFIYLFLEGWAKSDIYRGSLRLLSVWQWRRDHVIFRGSKIDEGEEYYFFQSGVSLKGGIKHRGT